MISTTAMVVYPCAISKYWSPSISRDRTNIKIAVVPHFLNILNPFIYPKTDIGINKMIFPATFISCALLKNMANSGSRLKLKETSGSPIPGKYIGKG